jgi:Holliday junction resolvase RusA-like endonuclease
MELRVVVPGEPVAQGRPRAFYRPGLGVRVFDPAKSRSWKGMAQVHMREAIAQAGAVAPLFADGPLELHVLAVFTCPRSHWRKREPLQRRPKSTKPDGENIAKAVQDAGTGLLWLDDAQVARLVVEKIVGAQGEAPYIELTVRLLQSAAEVCPMQRTDAAP